MKKSRNAIAIIGLCLFLGSMTSCKAVKNMKSKRCKCPKWSMEDKAPAKDAKAEATVKYEEVVAD